jgi:hypothetical protein
MGDRRSANKMFKSERRNILKENRPVRAVGRSFFQPPAGHLPAAVEVVSMAPAPSGMTPDRTSVSIGSWCRINRVLFDHNWWRRYNDRPFNDHRRSWLRDHNGGCRSRLICVGVSFPMVAWNFTVLRRWGYRQIGGDCWRGKSQCARHTQDRSMHDASFVDYALSSPNKANAEIRC